MRALRFVQSPLPSGCCSWQARQELRRRGQLPANRAERRRQLRTDVHRRRDAGVRVPTSVEGTPRRFRPSSSPASTPTSQRRSATGQRPTWSTLDFSDAVRPSLTNGHTPLAPVDRPAHRDRVHQRRLDRAQWPRDPSQLSGADRPGPAVRGSGEADAHPPMDGYCHRHRRNRRNTGEPDHPGRQGLGGRRAPRLGQRYDRGDEYRRGALEPAPDERECRRAFSQVDQSDRSERRAAGQFPGGGGANTLTKYVGIASWRTAAARRRPGGAGRRRGECRLRCAPR